jgi:hypothetical protein
MNRVMNILGAKYPDKDFHEDKFGRICFDYQGTDIFDPMSSECSRFQIDPMYYGIKMFDAVAMVSYNSQFADDGYSLEDSTDVKLDPSEYRGEDYGND